MAPKGVTSTEMWQKVARNFDKVNNIVTNGFDLLKLRESDEYSVRFTHIEKEIVRWRAILRDSKYLENNSKFVTNIMASY